MADYVDSVIRSSEKVMEHCDALLHTSLPLEERARLTQRVEAEREFIARMRATHERLAA